ncbi:DUF4198 domain-containing protein [Hydrogenivirga sp. 128-5-R1-1]|uniref:DUF4198 domain-containing protein n=1 Tax=Hydrogenivirga sp. 128-5-R1-1 TaxID=392423 RepID=UPI00015F06E6|nr:DUF4198 domain-containing protein [Hydrogenivirga sp. 128-5-R1-1]EDP74008.1 hypothetical protein HG1285_06888 [Hydrogenivirga sp. 128-5-R1-1]
MRSLIFLIGLFLINLTYAHDLWIEKHKNNYILYYGHKHPSYGEKKLIKYNPENIQSVKCIDKDGNKIEIDVKKEYPLVINKNCAIIYVDISSGYWTKTPYGTINKPKNQIDTPIKSWLSYENVKRINLWGKNLEKSFTKKLDIIPVNDPLKLQEGDKIRLLITFDGKPAKNIPVAYDGKVRGITDSHGRINIRIKHKGLQLIEATYKEKIISTKADEVIYSTTLNFEVN